MISRKLHTISFVIGISFLALSLVQALIFHYPQFYTSFALGSWLVLDWLDWKLTGFSILGYFWQHRHRDAFFVFFVSSTVFCFLVDFVYGVKLLKVWEWIGYGWVEFSRMYLVMNASYVLGMFELYRVLRTYFSYRLSGEHTMSFTVHRHVRSVLLWALVGGGMVMLAIPLYTVVFATSAYAEYVMLLPFVGMLLLADGVTGLLGGKPLLEEFARGNVLEIASTIGAVAIAAAITEGLNLAGGEWRYVKMPFPELTTFGIPVAVFIGWIPLVLGSLAVVNVVRRADAIWDRRNGGQ